MTTSPLKNSDAFIRNLNREFDKEFAVNGAKIGSVLRIRYPLTDPKMPKLSPSAAAAIGTATVLVKNPTISRRFWSKR